MNQHVSVQNGSGDVGRVELVVRVRRRAHFLRALAAGFFALLAAARFATGFLALATGFGAAGLAAPLARRFSAASGSANSTGMLWVKHFSSARFVMRQPSSVRSFTLPSIWGKRVTLSEYRGKKNVVISFVPAAWTPVCSDQWPGYNITKSFFEKYDAVLLGITVDNIPTLFAWTEEMGNLWFPVLSDFYPHGAVAEKYGVLRSSGISERALFVIDKKGIIRSIDVHDINKRPPFEDLVRELEKLE